MENIKIFEDFLNEKKDLKNNDEYIQDLKNFLKDIPKAADSVKLTINVDGIKIDMPFSKNVHSKLERFIKDEIYDINVRK